MTALKIKINIKTKLGIVTAFKKSKNEFKVKEEKKP